MQRDPVEAEAEANARAPERLWYRWFFVVLIANIGSLLWLAVRADSPPGMRTILDIFMQCAMGAVVAALAFRMLTFFPYRVSDLFAMVLVLSVAMKITLGVLSRFSAVGFIQMGFASTEHFGELLQTCMITASILLAGGALGLRACQKLKIERTWPRTVVLVAAMLTLPALAGSITFLILIAVEALKPNGNFESAPFFALLWLGSIGISIINIGNAVKMITLNAEVTAREHLP